jgi:archaellum component FlaC
MTTIYSDLLTYSPSANSFTFSVSLFPVIDGTFNVTRARASVSTSDWPTPKVSLPANTTLRTGQTYDASATQLNPRASQLNYFNTTVWKISFSAAGTTQNAFDVSAGRLITISSSGSVQVTDNYTIANRGAIAASIPFMLPKGITGVSASDFRPLVTPTPTVNPDGTETLTFTPRFGSVAFNQSVRVLITYQLSASTYISSGSVGSFTLNFAAFNNVKFYEPVLTTRIVTPMGFRLNTLTGQTPQVSGNQIVLQISPLTPTSGLGFSMTYQLSPFWAGLGPLSLVGLVEAALAASVLALWRGQGVEAMVGGVPTQLIGQFVDLYDERSSLRMEEDKMEEDMSRGALNRYDYKQRRRMMDRRVSEIDRALAPVKQQLSGSLGRYADMVRRLERAEAELQVIKTTAGDLKNQNRTGKISRELYESLSNDLVRRKGKAEQTIDTVIINLREEIR